MKSADFIGQALRVARERHLQGGLDEAIKLYRQVLKSVPNEPTALRLLGAAELQKGNFREAERILLRVIKIDPRDADPRINLGALYRNTRQYKKAVHQYREALRLKPDAMEAYYNLGGVYYDLEEYEAAIDAYENAIKFKPDYVEAYVNLGNTHKRLGLNTPRGWVPALQAYERALSIKPNLAEAYANIGSLFRDQNWLRASMIMYDKALDLDSKRLEYRIKRGLVALPIGELATGWDDYEFRFFNDLQAYARRPAPPQYWKGEDVCDHTIFVWPEQGLGEQILFGSLLPDLIARSGKVYIESKPRLARVFARSFPNAVILPRENDNDAVEPPADADRQIPLASLGGFFRRSFQEFPKHTRYLKADPEKTAKIRARYQNMASGRPIVGLSWRSKNEHLGSAKSAALVSWREILRMPDVWFVNLQYGDCRSDLAAAKAELGIEIYQDPEVDAMGDLDDFFAQVAALDLVISTSNTTVHVAGALNVNCWVLLPHGVGTLWYWFADREDSPWYPSLRLFRQTELNGDSWYDEIQRRVAAELRRWAPRKS
jgi:tetratricopeptide (TPR) repeat protein